MFNLPGSHVVAGSLGSRHGRAGLACVEDGGSSLLNRRDEHVLEPRVVLKDLKKKNNLNKNFMCY
jgi:hypothetical protein